MRIVAALLLTSSLAFADSRGIRYGSYKCGSSQLEVAPGDTTSVVKMTPGGEWLVQTDGTLVQSGKKQKRIAKATKDGFAITGEGAQTCTLHEDEAFADVLTGDSDSNNDIHKGPPKADPGQGRITTSSKQSFDDTTLTPDLVLAKISAAYFAGIKRCYKDALKVDASLRGKVELTFTVNETGRSTKGKASGFSTTIDQCVTNLMASWRFPIPKDKNGEATNASFAIALQLVPN